MPGDAAVLSGTDPYATCRIVITGNRNSVGQNGIHSHRRSREGTRPSDNSEIAERSGHLNIPRRRGGRIIGNIQFEFPQQVRRFNFAVSEHSPIIQGGHWAAGRHHIEIQRDRKRVVCADAYSEGNGFGFAGAQILTLQVYRLDIPNYACPVVCGQQLVGF